MTLIDWILLVFYFIVLIGIGYQATRRVENSEDFAVASNRITWPVLFATLGAAFIGGGASLGRAGDTFAAGYVFLFAGGAFYVQTILVGYFVAPRLKRYKDAQTVGDVMKEHYGSKVQFLTGILSLGVSVGFVGTQALAMGTVFNVILGVPTLAGILIGMGIVILYSTFGGMWAVVQTDILQFALLGVVLPLALIIGLSAVGGPAELVAQIPDAHFSFGGTYTITLFISVFLGYLLGEALIPSYTQRAFATPDAANARKGYTFSGIFGAFFAFVVSTIGLIALVLFPNIDQDQALPTLVANILPVGVTGIAVAALLAIVMSSADSYLNSASVVTIKDFYQPFINPNISERNRLRLEQVVNVVLGGAAIIFAVSVPTLVDALLLTYTMWAPTIIIPLLLAVIWGFRSEVAALSAIIGGGVTTAVWTWGFNEPFDVAGLVPGVIVNIIAFTIIYNVFDRGSRSTMERVP